MDRANENDGICPGRLPGQGSTSFDRTTVPPGEGRKVVLPLPGGGSKGDGGREGQDIGPPETEYGRAIYCDTTDSGALRCGRAAAGDTCPTAVVGAAGNRLESGEVKGGSGSGTGGSKLNGDGDTGIGSRSGFGTSPHVGVDRRWHRGRGVPGSQRFQRSGVERGGGLSLLERALSKTT